MTQSPYKKMIENKHITVLTRNSPTTYYYREGAYTGFEYDLMQAYAKSMGIDVTFVVKDNINQALELVKDKRIDVVAAGIIRTKAYERQFLSSDSYGVSEQKIVCKYGEKCPKNIDELLNYKPVVLKSSANEERLVSLRKDYPSLEWMSVEDVSVEKILKDVSVGKIACTIADSRIIDINRRYYPELRVSFSLSILQPLTWYMHKENKELQFSLNKWLKRFKASGELKVLEEKYYAVSEQYDFTDSKIFQKRIKTVFPKYIRIFIRAGNKYNMSPMVLSAMSYQESHWDKNAKSNTGVKGLMMLTKATAKFLKIKNRVDPKQSIYGGAKYLQYLATKIPHDVKKEDKIKFTLAAYNLGMGHMYDAIKLAKMLNMNPYVWKSMKYVLPLLMEEKYHKKLKYGYARGSEAVAYVEHIFHYLDMILVTYKERTTYVSKEVLDKRSLSYYISSYPKSF